MDDCHVVVRCKIASLMNRPEGNLFKQVSYTYMAEHVMLQLFSIIFKVNFLAFKLLELLQFYAKFEINDESGDPLTDHDMMQLHYSSITSLQVTDKAHLFCTTCWKRNHAKSSILNHRLSKNETMS